MACFIAPAVEAVVMTVVQKRVEKKEEEELRVYNSQHHGVIPENNRITWSRRLKWLNCMLWGGVVLLALEHVWHGEIVPWYPFLTAIENGQTMAMLGEVVTVGGIMALTITAVWAGVCFAIEKLSAKQNSILPDALVDKEGK